VEAGGSGDERLVILLSIVSRDDSDERRVRAQTQLGAKSRAGFGIRPKRSRVESVGDDLDLGLIVAKSDVDTARGLRTADDRMREVA
jgi:hypothetical protein